MTWQEIRLVVASAYVMAVTGLALATFSHPQDPGWGIAAVIVATLPAVLVAMPVVYVVGAAIWNITGADQGGPVWPVTLVYTLMFAGAAVANVLLLAFLGRRLRQRRLHRRQPADPASRT